MSEEKTLRFRTNSKLEKLIGRELITNNIIAFFELIKNSYDAGARKVEIKFVNMKDYYTDDTKKTKNHYINDYKVGADQIISTSDSYILIEDDGHGMSFEDIKNYWMEIGVVHKENIKQIELKNESINKMYKRVLNGEKGIGRFSTDKLGSELELRSIDKTGKEETSILFDWNKYNDHSLLLQDIEHNYILNYHNISQKSGVSLKIMQLRDEWTIKDIEELKRQLKKFVSPFSQEQNDFSIIFSLNEQREKILNDAFEYSLTSIEASIYSDGTLQYKISDQDFQFNEIVLQKEPVFGPAKLKIIYMDSAAKRAFTKRTGLSTREYGNIKVFRDNFRIYPYGERENDWLNIDNKHAQAVFRSLGTRDIIGYVQISNLENEGLKDATDRIGLVEDTKEFDEFKQFIWRCIDLLQNYIFNKIKREAEQQGNLIAFTVEKRKEQENLFKSEVIQALKDTQLPKKEADKIIGLIESNNKQLRKDLNEVQKANVVLNRKIKVFQRISGTEEILIDLLHTIKNKTAIIQANLTALAMENSSIDNEVNGISSVVTFINKLVDSALRKASSSRMIKKDEILSDILKESIDENLALCTKNSVKVISQFEDNYRRVHANRESIKIVLDNLFSNSIKALNGKNNKEITISTKYNQGSIELLFKDNGIGVKPEDAPFIFNISYTETKGNGLGLANSLDIIQNHKGDMVYVTFPDEIEEGAAFLIKLPVKG